MKGLDTKPFLVVPALAAFCSGGCTPGDGSAARPNVVFILLDDSGYCDFGCYGQKLIETPNIDALAARGIRFTDFYTGAPQSAPARCGLLTGLHNGHTQIRSNDELAWKGNVNSLAAMRDDPELEGQAPMAEGTETLGTVLQKAGYRTAMVGKWGLGGPSSGSVPNLMGFDFFYGYLCQRMAQCYYPQFMYRDGEREYLDNPFMEKGARLPDGSDPLDPGSYAAFKGNVYSPDALYREIDGFISSRDRRPFFLMWTTTIPHSAMQAPDEYVQHYVDKLGDEDPVPYNKDYFPSRYPMATYAAMITYLDHQVGQLVMRLKELGIYDDTIIIVTSDNGPAQNYRHSVYYDSARPFHSDNHYTKRTLQEGGIRMPFIVSWGDRFDGRTSGHIGHFADMMPTLCEMAGCDCPETDGVSLWPMISGRPEDQKEHGFLYWEFPAFKKERGFVAVRMGEWKGLIRNVADGGNHIELYRINEDTLEEHDLSDEHPDIVSAMWDVIRREHTDAANPLFHTPVTFPEQ